MKDQDKLSRVFSQLDAERQAMLLEFAEFLLARGGPVVTEIGDPLDIPRPAIETVVGALKRLKQTYPMIEGMSVFSKASGLMTEHMVQGRDAMDVIDEMEALFERAFRDLKQDR
jgi:hypothetical protein